MEDLPLNALRALVSIYEAGGIRPAARASSSSPSALHRYLRELEARVGSRLIEPGGGTVRFTATGHRLARSAQEALGALRNGVEAAREDRRNDDVVIATTESFARRWLLPRIADLRASHPRIVVSLRFGRELAQLPRDADLAIRLGSGPWPGELAEPLMDERIGPVLSPSLSAMLPGEASDKLFDTLLAMPLIHDRDTQASWRRWAIGSGIDQRLVRRGARLPSSDIVLHAAAIGLGVAMARHRLAADALADGSLIAPSGLHLPIGPSYWLVRQQNTRPSEEAVIEWLRKQALALT